MKKMRSMGLLATIVALAWPTMLEQLMQTAVQYIDVAMVGTLGDHATAAVGATSTVNWLVGSTISAIGIGFLSYIAKARGEGQDEKAKRASAQSVLAVIVVGLFFTALTASLSGIVPVWMQTSSSIRPLASQYFLIVYLPMLPRTASIIFGTVLRSAGDTKTPMKIGVLVNLINVVLNFFLIYPSRTVRLLGGEMWLPGAGLGVIGAAVASAVAFVVGGVLITAILFRHPTISPRGYSIRPDMSILRPCFRVAFPNMLQRFGTSFGYVAFASMINSLGDASTAAHTIANTVESLFYIPGYGMQTAAATLAGNAYGERNKEKMKDLARLMFPIEIGLMVVSGACLFVAAPTLVDIFSDDPEVMRLAVTVLRLVALSEPFFGYSIVAEGMMLGVGKTKEPFIYNLLGMWGVRIVGTFICTQILRYGLVSAWSCMIAHNLFLCLLFLVCFLRGRWNPLNKEDLSEGV